MPRKVGFEEKKSKVDLYSLTTTTKKERPVIWLSIYKPYLHFTSLAGNVPTFLCNSRPKMYGTLRKKNCISISHTRNKRKSLDFYNDH